MSYTSDDELDTLQKEYDSRRRRKDELRLILSQSNNELLKINSEMAKLGHKIQVLKHGAPLPHITDHAIVRYLERVRGVDIDEVVKEIAGTKGAIREGNVIITVITKDGQKA